MEFDAVILAGGRSSRLGGVPKAQLAVAGATLLGLALEAARGARRVVVVGPKAGGIPPEVLGCREDPPFAGPAAAIAAGLAALAGPGERAAGGPAALTLVLACDMPRVAAAVGALLAAGAGGQAGVPAGGRDGMMAVSSDGRHQPLVGLYRTAALQRAVDDAAGRNALVGGSVFALLASLELQTVPVPPGSTDDVDTWGDASALGVSEPGPGRSGTGLPNSTLEANGEKPG